MVKNDAGEVAMVYYQPTQMYISGRRTATGREYVFTTRYKGICMSWVSLIDVPALLAMKKSCCGGKRRPMFAYANEAQVAIWTNGSRGEAKADGCGC